jgi:hypothetical protein
MISKEQIATIRRLYYAEHWKVGTIAAEMRLHPETVKRALLNSSLDLRTCRQDVLNPWLDFIRQTLDQHPHLRATRLYEMLRGRGYQGSVRQVRRMVEKTRPLKREAFLRLSFLPGEHYGKCRVMLRGGGDPTFEGIFSAVVGFLCYITGFKETRANR